MCRFEYCDGEVFDRATLALQWLKRAGENPYMVQVSGHFGIQSRPSIEDV